MSVEADLARAVLAPRSIALVGASADETKYAALPQRYLRRHGYAGEIFPINPTRDVVLGERAYGSVAEVGRPVDHAFIMVPTAAVLGAVADCARADVRCATILSNGFAESGAAGRARQDELLTVARHGGLRILGPNSLGVINLQGKVALSANEILSLPELRPGRYGMISQSGSLMGALLSRGQARGLGFSKLVSVGNEADLGVAELGDMLVDDPGTDAILLFLETIRDARAFAAMARRAFEHRKPVVAYRLGRSAAAAELAASHTGALTANGPALDAFLRETGVVRVDTLEGLIEIAPLLVGRAPVKRRRVTVVTTTGGGGALVVDNLPDSVELVPPSTEAVERLASSGIAIALAPLIDLTLTGTNARTYGAVLRELLQSPACDLVVAVVGSSSQFRPDRAVAPIVEEASKAPGKPLAVYLTPEAPASLALLAEGGVAAFRTPESCADAVRAFLAWRPPRVWTPGAALGPRGEPAVPLNAADSARVFSDAGVRMASSVILAPRAAVESGALSALAFPVAAKVLSRDIPHKTEVGGVALGLATPGALRDACARILASVAAAHPQACIEGFEIQSMAAGLAEVLVGYGLDATVGPIVTLGAGGVLAEVYRDTATRLAPVDEEGAQEMIEEVRGLAPIRGYRGLPKGDLAGLGRAIVCVSRLALRQGPRVLEAEINPLMVGREGEGVLGVDALVVEEAI